MTPMAYHTLQGLTTFLYRMLSQLSYRECLGFTYAGAHKDDNDILRQMRTLYARSNRLLRIFHSCNTKVLIELGSQKLV